MAGLSSTMGAIIQIINSYNMKIYHIIFETDEEILSDFTIEAKDIKEARRIAQMHKYHCPNPKVFRSRVCIRECKNEK